ncbi:MAG: hypothetical protein ACRDUW_03435 [Pseudonocardiaceae bacterium]
MPFANPIVSGTKLVIPAIQSVNYVPGMAGWTINRDGTAEFASGTFRGAVVVIDPATGVVLASIGATGNGSFQNLAITGDLTFGTSSLLTELNNRAKGIVARFVSTSVLPASGNGAYVDIASLPWISEGTNRLYKIKIGPIGGFNSSGTAKDWLNRLNVSGTTAFQNQQDVTGGGTQAVNCEYTGTFAAGTQTATWAANGIGVAIAFSAISSTQPFVMTIEDVGPADTITGNAGSPGATTKIKSYTTFATRSYDNSGNFIGSPDGDNNIYYGGGGTRTYGNESDIILFDGTTMRTDLAGATILSAKLWLYCINSKDPAGSYQFHVGSETSLPSTFGSTAGNAFFVDQSWPVPGWGSIDMNVGSPTALSYIISNGMNSLKGSKVFSSENTGFSGFGGTASLRPHIDVTYSS